MAVVAHFQYPTLTEPLETGPEEARLDKWWMPASEPVRRPVVRPEGLFVYVVTPDQIPAPAVPDIWLSELPNPVRRAPQTHLTFLQHYTFFTIPSAVFDEPEPPQIPPRRKRLPRP